MTPIEKAAYDIGAKGSEPREDERLAFEAWMRGHCWKVEGDWDGKQYKHDCEDGEFVHGGAMNTRGLWAAWRDRGAVARVLAEQAQAGTCGYDESVGLCTSNPCCYQATPVQQAQVVEPVAWLVYVAEVQNQYVVDDIDDPQLVDDCTNHNAEVTPLYTHPASPAGERAKVGDSRFESWYSELHQAGKGSKQIAREAYEAGLNEAQQVAVPLSDEQIESLREKTFSTGNPYCPVDSKSMRKAARAIEARHGIKAKPSHTDWSAA